MKSKTPVLTKEERDVLLLVAAHLHRNKLSNSEIAQHLGISVGKVKRLMHISFQKLGVNNRIEAVRSAQRQGLINLKEFYSIDELADFFSALGPGILRQAACIARLDSPRYDPLLKDIEKVIFPDRRLDAKLTNRERDVIICIGLGLANKEIAGRLYITSSAAATFINRACRKLGANNRTDAFMIALRQREIIIGELCSAGDLLKILVSLGAESLEEIALLMNKKAGPAPADS